MEIRECLSVYLESGYLFDDMSGRLKWFEIDKILISFTYGVVRYVGTWGGCRTEKTLDGKLFYSSEECFKKGESIPKTRLSIYDVFESLYGFIIMPYIIKGKYFSTSGKYIDGKYKYRHKYSRVMFDYGDNCPLTGMCYDYYLLKPIIDYYNAWCTYPEDFSLEDLMRQCYDNFFKSWHEEYEYWADNEDAIREELHHNQYEDRLYYENGDVYVEPLNEIA